MCCSLRQRNRLMSSPPPTVPKLVPHPAIHKITCQDDTDSGSSGPDDRRYRLRSKRRESAGIGLRKIRGKVPHVRKMIARFDKNRRLSSVDSGGESAGSSPKGMVEGDPYDGFEQYEYGTPDERVQRIDINSMAAVFDRKELLPKVIVFSGELKRDDRDRDLDEYDLNNNLELEQEKNVEQRKSRDKQRRKSRDQRRESFNRLRNFEAGDSARSVDLDEAMCFDSTQVQFESMLQDITLDRPSEILPRNRRKLPGGGDQLDNVVTSSTGMPAMSGIPLLERFSEIFRIASLQQSKIAAKSTNSAEVVISSASSEGKLSSCCDRTFFVQLMLAGVGISYLLLLWQFISYQMRTE